MSSKPLLASLGSAVMRSLVDLEWDEIHQVGVHCCLGLLDHLALLLSYNLAVVGKKIELACSLLAQMVISQSLPHRFLLCTLVVLEQESLVLQRLQPLVG